MLARGILVMIGKLERRDRARKDWYSLETPKWDRFRRLWVRVGVDAFVTLEEAQKAAREIFERAAREAAVRSRELGLAVEKVERGELCVHDLTSADDNSRILNFHAFPKTENDAPSGRPPA